MTTTTPRYPFTRWIDAPLAAVRYLNKELSGAGGAMARSNRYPRPRPQDLCAQGRPAGSAWPGRSSMWSGKAEGVGFEPR
jgi:hypothetical protein